ncbi:PAS domain S-box protein [Candidatus Poribacteria bacterium]|nr:PAS domain S-box protein [Candidatus Poribacteria bacterium]
MPDLENNKSSSMELLGSLEQSLPNLLTYRALVDDIFRCSKCGIENESALQLSHDLERASEEIKRSIKSIKLLESKFNTITRINVDAIIIVDRDRIVRFVNPAAIDMFGRKREELLGELFTFPIFTDKVTEVSVYRSKEDMTVAEMRVIETIWLDKKAYFVVLRDITERKRLLDSLRESKRRYRLLAENLADVVWTIDMNLNFTYISPSVENVLNYKVDDVVNRAFSKFLTPESFKKALRILVEELSSKNNIKYRDQFRSRNMELEMTHKDGSKIWVETRVSFLRNKNGKPVEILGVAQDITEKKQTLEAMKQILKREAQAYDQGRLEIVDTILHNIGNAINSVNIGIGTIQENLDNNKLTRHLQFLAKMVKEHQDSFSSFVDNDPQGKKVAPFIIALADDFTRQNQELMRIVDRVRKRTEHISDIILTEKALSKRSSQLKESRLREALDNAVFLLQDSIEKRGIAVEIDCEKAPEFINIQETQFHQMMVNLIKNSIEAIDEREKTEKPSDPYFLNILCYTESDFLVIEVYDNGIGITKDRIDLIFRSGYTTKDSGSGLGLHSISKFMKSIGGKISAFSDGIGKGAKMRVELPLSSAGT